MANIGTKIGAVLATLGLFAVAALVFESMPGQTYTVLIRDPLYPRDKPRPPVVHPKGWEKIDFDGHFSVYAPPGSYHHPEQGIDSFVGDIVTPRFSMVFDFGLYSSHLDHMATQPGHVETPFDADGHPATMHVVPNGNGFVVGVYAGQVRCGRWILGLRCDARDSLMVKGTVHDATERDAAEAMLRTLQFEN
jgi:hypothetical protein